MFARIVSIAASVFLLTACSDTPEDTAASSTATLQNGYQFLEQGQFRAALIEGRNAIKAAPSDPKGYVLLGAITNRLGQYRQAIGALEPHAANSTDPDLLFTLVDAYLGTRKFRSASQTLDTHSTLLEAADAARFHNISADIDQNLRDQPAARAHYDAALAAEPGNVKARLGIVGLEWTSNNRGTAQDLLSEILREHPADVEALLVRARLALQSDDPDVAESALSSALASLPNTDIFTPKRTEILISLKNVLTQQGRTSEALTYSEMLSEAFPGSQQTESAMRDAVALFEEGKLDEAREVLMKLQEDNPGVAPAATLLGVINYMQGNNEVASEQFQQVLDPETAPSQTLQIYAMNELRLNQPERVLEALRDSIDQSQDANLVGLYGVAALSAGEPQEGVKALRRAIELDPEKARFRLLLARYHNSKSNPEPEQALEEVQRAAAIQPDDPFVQTALLEQLGMMNRLEEAGQHIKQMLTEYGDVASTHQIVGSFRFRTREFDEAHKAFRTALELNPDDVRSHFGVGRTALELKRYDEAAGSFRDVINISPENSQAYKGLITAAELNKNVAPVLEQIEREARPGETITPFMVLAEYFARNGNDDETDRVLALANEKAPDADMIRSFRVVLALSRAQRAAGAGDLAAGRTAVMAGLDINATDERLLGTLIDIEIRAGNMRESERLLETFKEAHPDSALGPMLYGDLALSKADLTNAGQYFRESWDKRATDTAAFKLYGVLRQGVTPASSDALLNEWEAQLPQSNLMKITRAGRYLELGNNTNAREIYEQLVQAAPNSVIALNNLAWIYLEDKPEAAIEMAKRAYDLAGESGDVVDTYGWILHQQGRSKEALELLEKAAQLKPDNEEIRGHLEAVRAAL